MPFSNHSSSKWYLCTKRSLKVFDFEQPKNGDSLKAFEFGGFSSWYPVCNMAKAMKSISSRIWVLVLGIAVALGIGMAAFLFNDQQPSTFSVTPSKNSVTSSSAAKLAKETLKKIHRTNLPTQ